MPRSNLRSGLALVALAATAFAAASALPTPLRAQGGGAIPLPSMNLGRPLQPSAALSEARARAAAERILLTLQQGDARARFEQFAPSLRRMTSPALVQSHMQRQPKVLAWKITAVEPGVDSSAVEATLTTSAGKRQLVMVIDGNGKLEAYHFDAADQSAEAVARSFVQALAEGRFVYAASFLGTDLQAEIPPASLQVKWQKLQRLTGGFVRVRKVFRSEDTPEMKLVMVNTEFNRLTDNLYVILDSTNTIIGVDFPTEPAAPQPAR